MFILSIVYTLKYKFIQISCLVEAKKVFKESKSSYLTFLMSLANHIGAGNIVGVTTALIYGGAGSIFWMIITCFFMGIFSLMENTLAIRYREKIKGEYRGGAAYYISKGFKSKKLAIVFSVVLVLTNTIFFGSLQVNTLVESIRIPFSISNYIIIILLLLFSFFIVFRGTKRILKFIEGIVPIMTLVFMGISIITIIYNYRLLPLVIKSIITSAFTFKSVSGAILGGNFIIGMKRSAFSNEAGFGTAPSISAMADVKRPLSQGFVQVLGVYIDTIVMCTLLGIMILMYDMELTKFQGAELAVNIFKEIFGNFGLYIGSFFLFTFSIATWVSSYYAGESNMLYVYNNTKISYHHSIHFYRFLYIVGTIIGVLFSVNILWNFVDYGLILLGTINTFVIMRLEKVFKEELNK